MIDAVRLVEIAEINPRLANESLDPSATVSFVPMAAVSEHSGSIVVENERPLCEVLKGFTFFQTGDVLVAKITPCFENGKIAHANIRNILGFGSTEFHVVRANPTLLNSRYLYHFLRQKRIRVEGKKKMTGSAGQRRIPKNYIENLKVPLPSLEEQQHIVEILDKAAALLEQRRQAISKIDTLLHSVFLDMFGGGYLSCFVTASSKCASHPSGWDWTRLTNIARLATGHTPSRRVPKYWNGNIPWISLSDIRRLDGKLASETSERISEEGIKNSASVKLPPGTVCFSRTASIGFVTMMGHEMATSQDFVNWVCTPNLNPTYLMWALIFSRKQLRALSTGSTHKTIYFPTVEQFRVLLPPIELQRRFETIALKLAHIKARQDSALAANESLFFSLQQRAFKGDLFFNGTMSVNSPESLKTMIQP